MSRKSKSTVNDKKYSDSVETDETTCSVCYAEFLEPEDLELHIQQVHPPTKIAGCLFCDKGFTSDEICAIHIKDDHLSDLRSCMYCSRVFDSAESLRVHLKKHDHGGSKRKQACSQCPSLFDSNIEVSQHELSVHSDVKDGVFLNKYYALLSSIINIKADSVIKAAGSNFIYVCTRCKYTDVDYKSYNSHLKEKGCRSLTCDGCYKVYSKRTGLLEHVTKYPECNDVTRRPIKKQCMICNEEFNKNVFKRHVRYCKVHKCAKCNIIFDSLYDLSAHQSQEHPLVVSLVVCKFCRREFVGNVALEKHIERTHNPELHLYKYACSYCDVVFKHPKRLFNHYFRIHKDLEPYSCKICDSKFRIRKRFTLHIKLVHNSMGFVEFDEKLHVFFADKKSEKPFQPVSKYAPATTVTNRNTAKEINKSGENEDVNLVNVNSDFMNPTETEGNQTDANDTVGQKRKRRTKTSHKQSEITEMVPLTDYYDSDDDTLLVIKKRAKIKERLRKKNMKKKAGKVPKRDIKRNLTCEICKKYCYTFQNYQNHVSMHFKDESKKCVKCSLTFKTKVDLERHLVEQHSSSKLTETLKKLLERRKKGGHEEISTTKKFLKTIKRVKIDKDRVTATLKPVKKELSVQSFIENFTPEVNESKGIQIKDSISLTKLTSQVKRAPIIKMTKFKPAPRINEATIRLAMPVKFKMSNDRQKQTVTIKRVKWNESERKVKLNFDYGNQFQDEDANENDLNDYTIDNYGDNDYVDSKDADIPEAEQEVTLEGTEEVPKRNITTHKIVIPKLPKELKSIRIAHLQPEAPYYKIVKMDDIINPQAQKQKKEETVKAVKKDEPVLLPDGTKLVHVNPLAHLLGDTPVEKIFTHTSNYKPKLKTKNFEDVLAKALLKLETPRQKRKVKKLKSSNSKPSLKGDQVDDITDPQNDDDADVNKESELTDVQPADDQTDNVQMEA